MEDQGTPVDDIGHNDRLLEKKAAELVGDLQGLLPSILTKYYLVW